MYVILLYQVPKICQLNESLSYSLKGERKDDRYHEQIT